MIKILIVVPYEELYEPARRCLRAADTGDFIVELEHFIGTDDTVIKRRDADIVVARGLTGKAMARANPAIHLVEISISGSDLIAALWKCRAERGGRGVGVVLTDAGICDAAQLEDLTGIPLYFRQADTEERLREAISELSALGVGTFIGGLTLCKRCDDLGLRYIHIKSGDEAMARAVNEAVAAARSLNRERTRANLVATVLNNAEDVMFALNKEGVVIAANTRASTLFCPGDRLPMEGRRVFDLHPEGEWELAVAAQPESEVLRTIRGQLMLVKTAPITVDRESVGVLVTCKNVEALRETEQKIRKELSKKGLVAHYRFENILSANAAMRKLIADALKYSRYDSSVFIVGETGTGKELFAQSIHSASRRSSHPFVAVNCAALPEQLLESELFGYAEGSFSGAVKGGRIGLFELAHKGTIFLDEIGEMPLSLQSKILRVLQEREIRKIGGDAIVPVDVRIVSATNIEILERVRNGSFREDLYYRINLLNLRIPPLRDRPEDIDLIFRHFVEKYSAETGKPAPRIEPGVSEAMRGYPWMGNIRELRNFSERLVILNESGVIDRREVDAQYALDERSGSCDDRSPGSPGASRRAECEASLSDRMRESGLDRNKFAESLGMSRTTLWRKLKEEARLKR
ncbi:MAG: sigma 54-interacting transcriptional regulator [Spirochaetes bacterium]|nr:sigma 54-interacting transcriptional regulator [Spirochaetota bacterium]MBU1079426.1 sigma 54-interacting transcriptional regulator [Spirochaetota bacterium]